jgi:hypothetical protein
MRMASVFLRFAFEWMHECTGKARTRSSPPFHTGFMERAAGLEYQRVRTRHGGISAQLCGDGPGSTMGASLQPIRHPRRERRAIVAHVLRDMVHAF